MYGVKNALNERGINVEETREPGRNRSEMTTIVNEFDAAMTSLSAVSWLAVRLKVGGGPSTYVRLR